MAVQEFLAGLILPLVHGGCSTDYIAHRFLGDYGQHAANF
jgi:hypothetical protein